MKRQLFLLVALLELACQSSAPSLRLNASRSSFTINNVTVIDGTGKPAWPHMRVTVKDGRIESVAPALQGYHIPGGVIDGTGKFLIPGLWDTHRHLVDIGEVAIPLLPTYGITSVRDAGGDVPRLKAWRARIEK